MDTVSNDGVNQDIALKSSESFLNIDLGKKIQTDLTEALATSTGRSKKETELALKGFTDLVEEIMKHQHSEAIKPFEQRTDGLGLHAPNISVHRFDHLTGEEKALAAEFAVISALSPEESRWISISESPMVRTYKENKLRSIGKAENAFVTNIDPKSPYTAEYSQPRVGTTDARMAHIEWLVRGMITGPANVEPYYTHTVQDYVTTDLGHKIEAGKYNYGYTDPDKFLRKELNNNPHFRDKTIQARTELLKVLPATKGNGNA